MARERGDLTIVAHSYAVVRALRVAEQLADEHDVSVEVVDLRTLRPLDFDTVAESVAKTTRALCVEEGWSTYGITAELAARIQDACFDWLDAPLGRVGAAEVPMPYAKNLEQAALPGEGKIRGRRPPRPRSVRFHDPGGHEPRAARARSRAGPAPSTPPIATVFGLTTSVSDSSPSSRPLRQTRSRLGPGSARRRSER